jgi:hypothetical protein
LPEGDDGFAVIKPSGGEPEVAIIRGGRVLVRPKDSDARLYDYRLGSDSGADLVQDTKDEAELRKKLDAFIQTATKSLMENTTGAMDDGESEKE